MKIGIDSRPELEMVLSRIEAAKTPEDMFGVGPANHVRSSWIQILKLVHPDKFQVDDPYQPRVLAATSKINVFWEEAKKRIDSGIYGTVSVLVAKEDPAMIQSRKYTYVLGRRIAVGGTCGVFEGIAQNKAGDALHVVVRVPHSKNDNDLMEREAKNLQHIRTNLEIKCSKESSDNALMVLPRILESVRLKDGKVINTFARIPGFEAGWFTLEDIRAKYPMGVSSRVMTFIFNRVLEGLALAHLSKVSHAAVTPRHVIIHAGKHLGNVIDWTSSCNSEKKEKIPYIDPKYGRFLAPGVAGAKLSDQTSDVYSAAMCMLYILGVDLELGGSSNYPSTYLSVEEPIVAFLNRCIQPLRKFRFADAEFARRAFRDVQKQVFGKSLFVELEM